MALRDRPLRHGDRDGGPDSAVAVAFRFRDGDGGPGSAGRFRDRDGGPGSAVAHRDGDRDGGPGSAVAVAYCPLRRRARCAQPDALASPTRETTTR